MPRSSLNQAWPRPTSPAVDIYQYASECVAVRDRSTGQYIGREDSGYSMQPSIDDATPFRMQATGLGSYLLYGPDGSMPEGKASGRVTPTPHAGPAADWMVKAKGDKLRLTNVSMGGNLAVSWRGRLTQSRSPNYRWRFEPFHGCSTFPEVEVNAEGTPPMGQVREPR